MSINKKNIVTTAKLFNEVAKNIEVFGEQYTFDVLLKERTENLLAKHLSFVIDVVCKNMDVSCEQIIKDKGRSNNKRVVAIKLISYYAYEKFSSSGMTFAIIGQRLKRKPPAIINHHTEIAEKIKDKSPENDWHQNMFSKIDLQLKKYCSINKHTKNEKRKTN